MTLQTKLYPLSLDLEDVLTLQTKLYPLSLDLEDVLTLQTKLYRCAHIFLGKCLPPVTSRRNPLLRTAYGISPDRNLRDRQVQWGGDNYSSGTAGGGGDRSEGQIDRRS